MSMFFPSLSFLFSTLLPLDNYFIYNIISLYFASFLFLFVSKFFKRYKITLTENFHNSMVNDFSSLFNVVMEKSITSIFSISYSILFFKTISFLFNLFIKNNLLNIVISGLLEFSNSSISILLLENKTFYHYLILNNILSFSSFSIIFQSLYYTNQINFKIKKMLFSRIAISIISTFIYMLIIFCIKN